jgi:hypothetical protein
MTAGLRRLISRRTKRADAFVTAHFDLCAQHAREAAAVHRSLERLRGEPIEQLDPELTIGELLPGSQVKGANRIAELQTLGQVLRQREMIRLALAQLAAEKIAHALLGSTGRESSWDPLTIWARSVRGVINERVRRTGGCSCGKGGSRPTNRRLSAAADE